MLGGLLGRREVIELVVWKVRLRVLHSVGADCGASVGVEGDVRALLSGGWEGEGRDESLYW